MDVQTDECAAASKVCALFSLFSYLYHLSSSCHASLTWITSKAIVHLSDNKASPNVRCLAINSSCLNHHTPMPFLTLLGTTPNSPISLPKSPTFPSGSGSWSDECSICYENMVDTVIYACGHMCLCYTCGLKLKKMANACCPICRRTIKDIIKTYRST